LSIKILKKKIDEMKLEKWTIMLLQIN